MTDACLVCGAKFINKHLRAVRKKYCAKCAPIVYYNQHHKHKKHGKVLVCAVCGVALGRYHVKYCTLKCLLIDYYRNRIDWNRDRRLRRQLKKLAAAKARDLISKIKQSTKRRYNNEI